jgi:type VI secretion system protein ImpA
MRYDWLFEPLSPAEPCGPDLDDAGDDKYLNYVLAVPGRIPERFVRSDTGKPIDRSEIKLKEEVEQIDALLKQTRDLRLLGIEARFQAFAGDLSGFADCIQAIAGLVQRYWTDVHPKAQDGDFTLRQNVLSGLDDFGQVIQPLQYASLVQDRRLGPITVRQFLVATGAARKRDDEQVLEIGEIHRSLAADETITQSDASYDATLRVSKSLAEIRDVFVENSGYDYIPNFDRLAAFFAQLVELFNAARPGLANAAASAEVAAGTEAEADTGGQAAAQAIEAAPRASATKGLVADHGDASAALLAVEDYFASREPSTPALILIHQARTLVGKPLIHALEILLPEAASRAIIKIQGEINVQLSMAQLKQLTAGVPKLANGANGVNGEAKAFTATSRAEAMTLMAEVEHFYKAAEPSSPVPMLLSKASGYLNRDFASILKDIIPAAPAVEKPPEKK